MLEVLKKVFWDIIWHHHPVFGQDLIDIHPTLEVEILVKSKPQQRLSKKKHCDQVILIEVHVV